MKLFDKFNEITAKNKNEVESIDDLNKKEEVEKWWNENMVARREDGKSKLYDLLEEFNISSMKKLAPLLGYKQSTIISDYTRANSTLSPSYDVKHKFYTFFHDELNIQPNIPEEKKERKAKRIIRKKDKIELVEETETKETTKTLFDFGMSEIITENKSKSNIEELIERYEKSIDNINDNIKRYETLMNNLITEKNCYEKMIMDLKELGK